MMRRSHPSYAVCGALGLLSIAHSTGALAEAETRFSVLTTASIGYSRNPFVSTRGSAGSASIEGGINPEFDILTATGKWSLSGHYTRSQYFTDYGGINTYGGDLGYSGRLSSRLNLMGNVDFDSSIAGQETGLIGGVIVDPTGTPPPNDKPTGGGTVIVPISPVGTDIGLLGTFQRRNTLTGSLGGSYALDSYNSLNFGVNGSMVRYSGSRLFNLGDDYDSYGAYVGYQRVLNSRSSIGVQVSVNKINYIDNGFPDSLIFSPQLTYQTKFSEAWSANIAVGASITRQDPIGPGFRRRTTVGPSLNGGVCRETSRSRFCASALRASTASGFAGVQTQTTFGVDYYRKLTERTSINASANYGHLSGGDIRFGIPKETFWGLNAGVDRRLSQRLHASVNAFYRHTSGLSIDRPSDFGGRFSISYIFGDLR